MVLLLPSNDLLHLENDTQQQKQVTTQCAPHRTMAEAHVSPAPNPAIATTSPALIFPSRTASSSARGMDAALVLPYLAKLHTTRSGGTPNRSAALLIMR